MSQLQLSRRSLLRGALILNASVALPDVLRSVPIIHGDGVHCDADGLQALFDGKPFTTLVDGINILSKGEIVISDGVFLLTRGLIISNDTHITIMSCNFDFRSDDISSPLGTLFTVR